MARIDGRAGDELRPIEIIPNINKFAEGSCLIRCGNTQVLCTASVEERTPPHVPEGEGWVTAEYSMLPRANRERSKRDIAKLKLSPRSAEIQRLVGRALRAAVDLEKLGPRTITVDCDVLQGDGGTRTASVTGGFVALSYALHKLVVDGALKEMPLRTCVAAISAGIVDDELLLDLFETKIEQLADEIENIYSDLEQLSRVIMEGHQGDEYDEALSTLAELEDIGWKVRLCLMDTQRALNFLVRKARLPGS